MPFAELHAKNDSGDAKNIAVKSTEIALFGKHCKINKYKLAKLV